MKLVALVLSLAVLPAAALDLCPSALAEKRSLAVAAAYPQLAQQGYAQTVITNTAWRYLDGAVRPQLANCSAGEAGRKAAVDFAGMLAVSMSHGNPIETHIMRQLLGK